MTKNDTIGAAPERLSSEQIEEFIDRGCLLLRECFAPEIARELVEDTLVRKTPMPCYRDSETTGDVPIEQLDLLRPRSWPSVRLYLETGRSLPIDTFAPKLWGAIESLIGPKHHIERRTMGEQFILNGRGALLRSLVMRPSWHIDEPGPRTSLEGRRDALVLLILWSEVRDRGGGPLYSVKSLDQVVAELDRAGAVDTMPARWGTKIAKRCGDGCELTGAPGDVLILHPFMLHGQQRNPSTAIRVLENPMVRVSEPLDYLPDNQAASPVEACVIRRRAGA